MLYTFIKQKLVDDQLTLDTIDGKMYSKITYHTGMTVEETTDKFDFAAWMLRNDIHSLQADILRILSGKYGEIHDEERQNYNEQLEELADLQASIDYPFHEVDKSIRYEYHPDHIRVYKNASEYEEATSFKDASKIAINYLFESRDEAIESLTKASSEMEKLELRVAIDKANALLRGLA